MAELGFGLKFVWLLVLGILLRTATSVADQPRSGSDDIPSQIGEYYADRNFVHCFSTHSERRQLGRFVSQSLLPRRMRSQRLKRIRALMRELEARVLRLDPGILAWPPAAEHLASLAELIEIRAAASRTDTLNVSVCVYALADSTNIRLVAEYEERDEAPKSLRSPAQRLELVRSAPCREEIHIWILTGGEWMKAEANIVLLPAP